MALLPEHWNGWEQVEESRFGWLEIGGKLKVTVHENSAQRMEKDEPPYCVRLFVENHGNEGVHLQLMLLFFCC